MSVEKSEEIKFLQNLEDQLVQLNTMNLNGLATYLVDNFSCYKEVIQLLFTGKNYYSFPILLRKFIMELRNSEDCMRWFIENISHYNQLVRLEKEEAAYARASKNSLTSPEQLQSLWNTVWTRYKKPTDSHAYAI